MKKLHIAALALVIVALGAGFAHIYGKAEQLERDHAKAEAMTAGRPTVVISSSIPESSAVSSVAPESEEPTLWNVPLDEDVQLAVIESCEKHDIDPAVVFAIIYHESRFQPEVMGDQGRSYGLMQIQQKFHLDRMERLGVTDLLDPVQNVVVGIDILAELADMYDGNISKALVAYQNGPTGAERNFFSDGVYENAFSRFVFEKAGEFHGC